MTIRLMVMERKLQVPPTVRSNSSINHPELSFRPELFTCGDLAQCWVMGLVPVLLYLLCGVGLGYYCMVLWPWLWLWLHDFTLILSDMLDGDTTAIKEVRAFNWM